MKYSAIVLAGGVGTRSGLKINKVYSEYNNKVILNYSIDLFLKDKDCGQVIVVCNKDDFNKYSKCPLTSRLILAYPGNTRQESVLHGMAAVVNDYVMIHDGARPFIDERIINDCKQSLMIHKAVLVAMPCSDTIKYGHEYIEKTLDRSLLYVAQTPQCFHTSFYYDLAIKAYKDNINVTDDCSIVEIYSKENIAIVKGSNKNIKLTWPEDFK